jgi:hypothetical protein
MTTFTTEIVRSFADFEGPPLKDRAALLLCLGFDELSKVEPRFENQKHEGTSPCLLMIELLVVHSGFSQLHECNHPSAGNRTWGLDRRVPFTNWF